MKKKNWKRRPRTKRSVDKTQDKRIKALEGFIYKTIENKQVNYQTSAFVNSTGLSVGAFISMASGAEDGALVGDSSRIGDSITLLKQEFCANLAISDQTLPAAEKYNRVRILLVESTEGNESLQLSDVLLYPSYVLHADQVFVSPYTTKANTNKRYKVHMDRTINLNAYKDTYATIKHVCRYREGGSNGKVVTYDGPTNAGPNNHRLTLLAISDSSVLPSPVLNYSLRSTYKDA